MRKLIPIICATFIYCLPVYAQPRGASPVKEEKTTPVKEDKSNLTDIVYNPDHTVITDHATTIKGQRISYKATTGTLPVWDEEGNCIAGLFFTYYERSDTKDRDARPLVISFNGGPG